MHWIGAVSAGNVFRLPDELNQLEEPEGADGQWYYLMTTGFEIDEPWIDESDLELEPDMMDSPKNLNHPEKMK